MNANKISKYDIIIFDLDGTIINSRHSIFLSLNEAASNNNLKFKFVASDLNLSMPLNKLIDLNLKGYSQDIKSKFKSTFINLYDNKYLLKCNLYDDIYQLLFDLYNQKKELFIVTNKRKKPTAMILDYFKLNKFFLDVYCIDTFPSIENKAELIVKILLERDYKKNQVIYIGDTDQDKISSSCAGVDFLKVDNRRE